MYLKGINPIIVLFRDQYLFFSFFITSFVRTAYAKLTNKKLRSQRYAGGRVISQEKANLILKDAILSKKSFFFGRHGSAELNIATQALWEKKKIKNIDLAVVKKSENCGFFAIRKQDVSKFLSLIEESSREIDMYGTFRMVLEDYYIKMFMPKDVILTHLNMLDFWRYEEPFTYALKDKKVLVIHPLADKIAAQYEKRELLFKNSKILPEFELHTLKAIQTIMGNRDSRFETWFDALDYMYDEAQKIDFEVAILGCGAYGMPLAARIKQTGKTVIYMGGVTQMLFGIKGDRWDRDPVANKLYNEHWIRPGEEDKPRNFEKVEEGCYW